MCKSFFSFNHLWSFYIPFNVSPFFVMLKSTVIEMTLHPNNPTHPTHYWLLQPSILIPECRIIISITDTWQQAHYAHYSETTDHWTHAFTAMCSFREWLVVVISKNHLSSCLVLQLFFHMKSPRLPASWVMSVKNIMCNLTSDCECGQILLALLKATPIKRALTWSSLKNYKI